MPEEVLRTFTNSIDHSKRSLALNSHLPHEDLLNLSPIHLKDKNLGKNGIREVQKLAKEIK